MNKKVGLLGKLAAALLAVAMLGSLLAACGKASENIVIWAGTYWGGDNEAVLNQMVDEWNGYADENGKVRAEVKVLQDMHGAISTGAISGRICDIVLWDRWQSLSFAYQKVFAPIDEKLISLGSNVSEFNAAAMRETKFEDNHYGIPFDLDTWGIFVNTNVYLAWAKGVTDDTVKAWLVNGGKTEESAGGENSKFNYPETWSQFYTAASGCTQKDAGGNLTRAGISADIEFVSWMATTGGKIADLDKQEIVFISDEKIPGLPAGVDKSYKDAATEVLNMWDKFLLQDTDSDAEKAQAITSFGFFSNQGMLDPFISGKVAFKINSILNGRLVYEKYKLDDFEFDYIPFPSQDSVKKRGGMLGGYSMSVPAKAPKSDAAWELISWWLLNDDNYAEWCELSKLIPTKTSVLTKLRADEAFMAAAPYLKAPIDNIANYQTRPSLISYSIYETSFQSPALDSYLRRSSKAPGGLSGTDLIDHYKETFFNVISTKKDLS
jgi:ABC-type glycerol-3-phosphate transport system substrate-binding protein